MRMPGRFCGRALRGTMTAHSLASRPVDPVQTARKRLGYKNNWSRREVADEEQHTWAHPMPDKPLVAIVGGGLSGLACANELAALGIRSVVFDTGKHSVGGRLATRASRDASLKPYPPARPPSRPGAAPGAKSTTQTTRLDLASAGLMFDHAAQFFTATDPRFKALVASWEDAGIVHPWLGPLGTLTASPQPTPAAAAAAAARGEGGPGGAANGAKGQSVQVRWTPLGLGQGAGAAYVGSQGMRGIAQHMAQQLTRRRPDLVEVRRPVWVSSMRPLPSAGGWQLQGEGRPQGIFDFVVVAHNGKCANRLVGPAGAPRVARQLMSLRLNAVWVLLVAFRQPLDPGFEGAFIQGCPLLSWAASNTRKLELRHTPPGLDCWTLVSTAQYGARNKVPQEAVPEDVQDKVSSELLAALARHLGHPGSPAALPEVVYSRCQLWGAALPLNSPGVECIVDPWSRTGCCGDWLLGSSMQDAAVSGIAMARRIAALRGVPMDTGLEQHALGLLNAAARPVGGPSCNDIGAFPGVTLAAHLTPRDAAGRAPAVALAVKQ
ncbi:hypothetical protein QJQ45_025751 [Haematococcus lacustris]|nr:hypothetical protein QJQ45_025751 [Haematococcus lacustris]